MLKRNRVPLILLGAVFLVFLYTIHDLLEQRIVEAGDKAPAFSITTQSGQKVSRDEFGGKLLVLNFWATWCPPCIEEMPSLSQFAKQMSPRDPEESISSSYGSFKWPETYVINREGKVVQKHIGPRNWTDPELVNSIKGLL
jgi:thiol-disulfide isomerase/thioredoxin